MIRECKRHGPTDHYWRKDHEAWRCRRCIGEAVTRRRRKIKAELVAERGGKCERCGYDKSIAALHFHHRDPTTKDKAVHGGNSLSMERHRAEVAKCDLLCANCHAEVEEERRNL